MVSVPSMSRGVGEGMGVSGVEVGEGVKVKVGERLGVGVAVASAGGAAQAVVSRISTSREMSRFIRSDSTAQHGPTACLGVSPHGLPKVGVWQRKWPHREHSELG